MAAPAMIGYPLAPQQRRLWQLQQGERGLPPRIVGALRIDGEVAFERLRSAVASVVASHEILRTRFRRLPGMSLPLQTVSDLAAVWIEAPSTVRLEALLEELSRWPVDLEEGPVVEVALAPLGESAHLLLLSLPGLCADLRSLELLAHEIGRAYGGAIGEEPVQYVDLAEWQNELLTSEETAEAREHWLRLDLSALSEVRLVRDAQATATGPFAPRRWSEPVPPRLARRLESLAAELESSLPVVLLAGCRALVQRLTGRGETVFGVAHDGRRYAELVGSPGLLVRYLPVPGGAGPGDGFDDLVRRETRAIAQSRSWQESFTWPEEGTPSAIPLLFDGFEAADAFVSGGLSWSLDAYRDCPERFEVRFSWARRGGSLRLDLELDPCLFAAPEAPALATRLFGLLEAAVAAPEAEIGSLEILGKAERQALLFEANDTATARPAAWRLDALFRGQAVRTPDRIAAQFGEHQLSYASLAGRAARLAGLLMHRGIGPDRRVGILMERSLDLLISLLAVLEAGGAYVPIDPAYPAERVLFMLKDAQPEAVLAEPAVAERFSLDPGSVIDVDEAARSAFVANPRGEPEDLAYVIYTSGSTGRPKGVMISHGAIVNRLLWMQRRFPLDGDDFVLQKTPVSFDASVWELFLPLLVGARVVLAEPGAHRDPAELVNLIRLRAITVLQLVPSQLGALLDQADAAECGSLRRLFCGGESLPRRLEGRFRALLGAETINLYGPTESSIDASFHPCGREGEGRDSGIVPIGRPLDNVELFLVDAGLMPVGIGQVGEILIGGAGLARGYLARPDLTAERFIPSPFGDRQGARLYRTGDLGRFLPDLEIEFIGRRDHQVKLRGFRIELGEVEAALAEHPEVAGVVAAVRDDAVTGAHLVAYCVRRRDAGSTGWIESLRALAQSRLPAYMIPAHFVELAALPLSPNGKVDRRSLPAPELAAAHSGAPESVPRSPVEELIAEIWSDVLAVPRPGGADNFFDLGGHSLVATRVVARLKAAFRIELPLHALFSSPTVAGLAAAVEAARGAGARLAAPPIGRVSREGDPPLSFAQQRLWFQEHFQPGQATYNIPTSARLSGVLQIGPMARALNEIVRRHEILRTIYPGEDGRPRQVILPELKLQLPEVDLAALGAPLGESETRRAAAELARWPLDLAAGPLLRAALFKLAPEDHVVACIFHHIVSDAWSGSVLMRELSRIYAAFCAGLPSPLADLALQYSDFAGWQRAWLEGEALEVQRSYWRRLVGAPPLLALSTDRPRPAVLSTRGATLPFRVPPEVVRSLRALGRHEGATLFMTLLGAFHVLLYGETGQEDLVVGTDVANRNRVETEGLIGFFINQLILRTDLSGNPTFRSLLARVREVTLGAYEHQDLPFEQVLEIMKPQRTLSHALGFQVKLFLVNTPPVRFELPGLTLSPFGIESGTSRLDLVVALTETSDELTGWVNYCVDLFDRETIERLMRFYVEVLRRAGEEPDLSLKDLAAHLAAVRRQEEKEAARHRGQAKLERFKRHRALSVAPLEAAAAGFADQES